MSKASDLARLITSGSTAIHGEAGVTSSGSTGLTTNLQNGLAKSWVNSDGDASTPAARDSLNLSSVTDSETGKGIFTLTSNMTNDDFATTAGGSTELVALNRNTTSWSNSTSQYGFVTYKTDGDAVFDFDQVLCVVHGDLA